MHDLSYESKLADSLPTPLAELYGDAHNATSPLALHQNAFYLFEVAIKLLGSTCIIAYAERGTPDPKIVDQLKKLSRPTTGEWWGFVQLLLPVLAKDDEGFKAVQKLIFKTVSTDMPHATGLYVQLRKRFAKAKAPTPSDAPAGSDSGDSSASGDSKDGAAKRKKKDSGPRSTVRLNELFNLIVKYRNKEMGHGALGKHPAEFYEKWGRTFLTGMGDVLARLDVLAGRKLSYVSEVKQDDAGNWLVHRYLLSGPNPRLDRKVTKDSDRLKLPKRGRVYIELADVPLDQPGAMMSLHPLVLYDEHKKQTLLLDVRDERSQSGQIEYLSYHNSEHVDRPDLGDEQRELLARVLGMAVSEDQAKQWAAEAEAAAVAEQQQEPTEPEAPAERELADYELPTIGDFQLLSILGEGGMGRVYRAWDPSLQRVVALKCLLRPGNAKHEARFARETRALARVKHPNLAEILSDGAEGDQYYFAMELVEGTSLETLCETLHTQSATVSAVDQKLWNSSIESAVAQTRSSERPISDSMPTIPLTGGSKLVQPTPAALKDGSYVRQIVELLAQVTEATETLHSAGIVHRDIKPGNIIVDPSGKRAVLVDLGLAQLTEEGAGNLTKTREMLGTLQYASPEQVLALGKLDRRSDVYSLGATLWELLTLKPLYGATKNMAPVELAKRIQYSEPEPLRKHYPGISPDLDAIVAKCLEKEADQRYQTARDLADDLRRFLAGEPVTARPVSDLTRFTRLCRRNKLVTSLAVATVVLAVVGFGFSTVMWFSSHEHWLQAEEQRKAADDAKKVAEDEKQRAIEARDEADRHKREAEKARDEAKQQERYAMVAKELAEKQTKIAETQKARAESSERASRENLYVANIRLAHSLLGSGEVRASWDLLQSLAKSIGKQDWFHELLSPTISPHRFWEWEYLTELCNQQLRVIRADSWQTHVVVNPKGSSFFTGDGDGNVVQWSIRDGSVVRRFPKFGTPESCPGFSLRHDQGKLIVASRTPIYQKDDKVDLPDPGMELVSIADGEGKMIPVEGLSDERVIKLFAGPDGSKVDIDVRPAPEAAIKRFSITRKKYDSLGLSGGVSALCVTPDGKLLATSGYDKTIRIWAIEGYLFPACVLGGANLPDYVSSFDVESDSRRFVMSLGKLVVTGDIAVVPMKASVIGDVPDRHTETVTNVAFIPGRPWAVSASDDGNVKLWDVTANKILDTYDVNVSNTQKGFKNLDVAADGSRVAAVTIRGKIMCWDLTDEGKLKYVSGFGSKPSSFQHLAFRPSDGLLGATMYDGTVRLFDRTGADKQILPVSMGPVGDLAFSPDGELLVTVSRDRSIAMRWLDGKIDDQRNVKPGALDIAFTPDGRRVVAADGGTIRVLDSVTLRTVAKYAKYQNFFAPAADGKSCIVARDGDVMQLDLGTGKETPLCSVPTGKVAAVAWSPDGTLVTASNDDQNKPAIVVYDTEQRRIVRTLEPSGSNLGWGCFSDDGKCLAHRASSKVVDIWRVDRNYEHTNIENNDVPFCGIFEPKSHRLVVGGMDGLVNFYEVAVKDEKLQATHSFELSGHRSFVTDIAFTPDAMRMITCGTDGTVRTWNTDARHGGLILQHSTTAAVMSVALESNGWRIVSGGEDDIKLWDAGGMSSIAIQEDPWCRVVRGCRFNDQRQYEAAIQDFSDAIEFGVEDPYVWEYRGWANAQFRRHVEAERDLTTAIDRLPNDPSLWIRRSLAHSAAGKIDKAESDLAQAIELVGDVFKMAKNTRWTTAKTEEAAAELFDWAYLIDDMTTIIQRGDAPWDVYRARALAYCDLSRYTDATLDYDEATKRNPNDWQSWRGLARCHMSRRAKVGETIEQTFELAAQACEQALKLKPDDWELLYMLAICHRDTEKYEESIKDFEAAIRQQKVWPLYYERGTIHLERLEYDRARDDFEQAKKLGAGGDELSSRYAYACIGAKDTKAYRELCEDVVRTPKEGLTPSQANSIAWACVIGPGGLTNPQRAVEFAAMADDGKPNDYNYLSTLGTALFRAGEYQKAIDKLNEAIKFRKDGATPYDHFVFAMAHHELGRKDEARKSLEAARVWIAERAATLKEGKGIPDFYSALDRVQYAFLEREVRERLGEDSGNVMP